MQVEEYLQQKGWDYKNSGNDNYAVKICPVCQDDRWHFGIHKTLGLWRCVNGTCGADGNLHTLKKHLGDIIETKKFSPEVEETSSIPLSKITALELALAQSSHAQDYLTARGINKVTSTLFRLGLGTDTRGDWLAIPYLTNGECIDVKYRLLPPGKKQFTKEPGVSPCLYNIDAIKKESTVFLTEGELDCISMCQLGFLNTVSVPLGCGTFKPEHWDALAGKSKIYFLFDKDMAGKKGAQRIAERLDPSRCFDVDLPGANDVNEFLVNGGTREQLDYLIEHSKPYGKPAAYNVMQALEELGQNLEQGELIEGPVFPWEGVRNLFGPMAPEETTIILGVAGVGKTSYALQAITYVARVCKTPALLLCLEMPIHRLAQLLVAQTTGCDRGTVTSGHITQAMIALYGVPLYLARRPSTMDWDAIHELLVASIRRFGVKVWVFDNIQFLCRGHDMVQSVGIASQKLKMLAEETKTHGIVISHPRKIEPGAVPSMYDAAWSQALAADADAIHVVHRKQITTTARIAQRDDFTGAVATFEDKVIVHAAKTRYGGGGGTVLRLLGPSGRFITVPTVK